MTLDDLSVPQAAQALEVVNQLLHDWVKYMGMILGSLDWEDLPSDADRLVRKAIEQTRKLGDTRHSVATLWANARPTLVASAHRELVRLAEALDADALALQDLATWDVARLRRDATEARRRAAAPGDRLRQAQLLLSDRVPDL